MATSLDLSDAPRRNPSVASVVIDGDRLLAHEGTRQPVTLNPLGCAMWDSFDGVTTVGELLEDIEAAVGTGSSRGDVLDLIDQLRRERYLFVDDQGFATPVPLPRFLHPLVPPSSCTGRRIGLGRANLRDLWFDGRPVARFGVTDPSLANETGTALDAVGLAHDVADENVALRTFVLRVSQGRTRRRQQLFDTLGDVLYASHNVVEAYEALTRSLASEIERSSSTSDAAVWVNGPALLLPRGVVLLHPALTSAVLRLHGERAFHQSAQFLPAAATILGGRPGALRVILPRSVAGHPAAEHELAGVLVPGGAPPRAVDGARRLCHLFSRWDARHLDTVSGLASGDDVTYLSAPTTVEEVQRALADLL